MSCINHPDKAGKFQCTSCQIVLCNQCIKSFQAGGFFTYFCPACNSQCEEIDEKTSPPTAPSAAPQPPPAAPEEKKISVPVQEKRIKVEAPPIDLTPEEITLPEESPPLPKASVTPPAGRKIIKLKTDDLDEMPPGTSASSTPPALGPSLLKKTVPSPEKKIPVPTPEKKIKIEAPAIDLAPEEIALPEESPPLPKASVTPPAGRKIIKLETDDLDEMPPGTSASSTPPAQGPSVPEKQALAPEITPPSFLDYFLTLFFKPGYTFKTMAIQMEKSMPLKIRSLAGFLGFFSLLVFMRFQNHPFTFSMLSSLTDTVLFLFFFTLFSVPPQEIKSKVNLGMCGLTLFSFLQTLHIAVVNSLSSMALTDYALYSGLAFILFKLWVFFKGFKSFNDKGIFQNLLYVLIVLFSQWLAESVFFQWFYI